MMYNRGIEIAVRDVGTSNGCMLYGVTHLMRKYTPEEQIAVFWSRVSIPNNINKCWEWERGLTPDGYGIYNYKNEQRAHRVSWIFNYGEIPDSLHVLHKCDNRKCCNPKHLFLGTNDDNVKDKVDKGRCADVQGEKNPRCKLSDYDVSEIRRLHLIGHNYAEIATIYNCSISHVNKLVNKRFTKR